jgi:bilirubin oxidase
VPAASERLLVIPTCVSRGWSDPGTCHGLAGRREGNCVLVNGQYQPVLAINPGQSQRWRILNATNARYLRLALTGHTLTLIGTDGGLLRSPLPGLDEILLAPAERVEVIVTASLSSQASAVLQACPTTAAAWA